MAGLYRCKGKMLEEPFAAFWGGGEDCSGQGKKNKNKQTEITEIKKEEAEENTEDVLWQSGYLKFLKELFL